MYSKQNSLFLGVCEYQNLYTVCKNNHFQTKKSKKTVTNTEALELLKVVDSDITNSEEN